MKPLKQPLSYDEQIKRLREYHGLRIEDERAAKLILGRVNYYRLSAYGIGLKQADDPDKYADGVSLQHLYQLYLFDCALRAALLPVVEEVEIELRTKIAYHLAIQYGAEGYRNERNFADVLRSDACSVHAETMKKFDKEIQRQSNLPCVKHHQEVYGGHFPIWAAVELFSFGMLSSLYAVMKKEDKAAIASEYGTDAAHLKGWILSLVEIRNICAHYGRLYNMPLKQAPRLYSEHAQYAGNRIFPRLLVMKRMLHGSPTWVSCQSAISTLLEVHPEVNLHFIGFPENWKEIL